MFQGIKICDAFTQAIDVVKFKFGSQEAELFVMHRNFDQDNDGNHKCHSISLPNSGKFMCESDHISIKQIPSNDNLFRCNEK